MTSYEDIFNCFLRKIDDVELAKNIELSQDFVVADMIGWLHSAVAKIGLIQQDSITFDDDNLQIDEDLTDLDIEIYSLGMCVEWLTPYVKSRKNLAQLFGGKEEKFYSQQQHLTVLKEMLADDKTEIRKLKRDYDYQHNDYVDEDTTTST